eukprot:CAMPEP_0172741738 /NCGR_PEP_ID=MMETSP1074-20121228/127895_1 /TAXON_ID=2916 /ORGANISM="Ceratium fusus, Strain PA161109" /LENGTH=96 /DNA_ID=CAMNT_0013572115 /DNA_START=114 /DNA_END=404 /DNA_ORIENTATION=-
MCWQGRPVIKAPCRNVSMQIEQLCSSGAWNRTRGRPIASLLESRGRSDRRPSATSSAMSKTEFPKAVALPITVEDPDKLSATETTPESEDSEASDG